MTQQIALFSPSTKTIYFYNSTKIDGGFLHDVSMKGVIYCYQNNWKSIKSNANKMETSWY